MSKDIKQMISGTFDIIFKTIMTKEEHRDFVFAFLHEITKISKEDLKQNFVQMYSHLPTEHKSQKKGDVDILYCFGKNNYINLEMNLEYSESLLIKNNYYHCKIMAENFYSGEIYKNGKIIQINLNNFEINKENKKINLYKIMNTYSYHVENENFIKYHISMKKIYKMCYNKDNSRLTLFEKMISILMERNKERLVKLSENNHMLEKVARRIIDMNNENFCIGMYDKELVDRKFKAMLEEEIERKAMKKGMKKGIEKGIEKGMEKGMEKGKYEIIKNMLKNNLEISFIEKMTNIPRNEILKLKENL